MMHRPFATALLCCLPLAALTESLPAQEFVLIVRTGPTDLMLNASLARAIANEPEVGAAIERQFGDRIQGFEPIYVEEPSGQEPGTYQLHFTIELQHRPDAEPPKPDAVIDAVRTHVEKRIDYLLHEEPRSRLQERCHRLTVELGKLMMLQEKLTEKTGTLAAEIARRRDSMHAVTADAAEARINVATEERAVERLEKVTRDYSNQRHVLMVRTDKVNVELNTVATKLSALRDRIATVKAKKEVLALQDELANLTAEHENLQVERDRLLQQDMDVQKMLTSVLAELPTVTVELERRRARLQSLEATQKTHDEVMARLDRQRKELFEARVQSQGLQLDIDACRDQLMEIHRKLARMEPVRFDVLRPR